MAVDDVSLHSERIFRFDSLQERRAIGRRRGVDRDNPNHLQRVDHPRDSRSARQGAPTVVVDRLHVQPVDP